MPTLWLPKDREEAMAREALAEQRQMAEELNRVTGALEHYNRELQKIDPHLRVVLAKPNTTVEGLKPGYYHIVRLRPGTMAYIKPIEDPETGAWRDLDSSIFDLVAEDDLWNDRVQREKRAKARKALEAKQRQREREAMDRAREFDERWKAANSVQILVPKGVTS